MADPRARGSSSEADTSAAAAHEQEHDEARLLLDSLVGAAAAGELTGSQELLPRLLALRAKLDAGQAWRQRAAQVGWMAGCSQPPPPRYKHARRPSAAACALLPPPLRR